MVVLLFAICGRVVVWSLVFHLSFINGVRILSIGGGGDALVLNPTSSSFGVVCHTLSIVLPVIRIDINVLIPLFSIFIRVIDS